MSKGFPALYTGEGSKAEVEHRENTARKQERKKGLPNRINC